jgi:hypothetical protein
LLESTHLTEHQNTPQIIDPLPILNTEFIAKKAIPTTTTSKAKSYSPIKTLAPYFWMPAAKFGNGLTQFGVSVYGSDVLERHQYNANILLESNNQEPSAFLKYKYHHNWNISAARVLYKITTDNNAYLRKRDSLRVNYLIPNTQSNALQNWYIGGGFSNESDLAKKVNAPSFINIDSTSVGIGYIYKSAKRYLLSYNDSDGQVFRATTEYKKKSYRTQATTKLAIDWRYFLSLSNQQVLVSRVVIASSDNTQSYSLGGTASSASLNLLSGANIDPLFGRTSYPLRGYDNTGFASNVFIGSLEWRIPINRPERGLWQLPIATMQNSYNLFIDVGSLFDTQKIFYPQKSFALKTSIGVEIINNISLFYRMPITLRLGIAHTLNQNEQTIPYYFEFGKQF